LKKIKSIIGDGDSCSTHKQINYNFLHNQYYTDFEKSLKFLKIRGYKNIFVFGATGGMTDHYLGNISTSKKYHSVLNITYIDHYHYYLFLKKNMRFDNVKNRIISIIPLLRLQNVTLVGCKYPLKNENLNFDRYISIRNYATKQSIIVNYKKGGGIIFISHKINSKTIF